MDGTKLFFFGQEQPKCPELTPNKFCHVHEELPRTSILFWVAITTFCSFFVFLFSLMSESSNDGTLRAIEETLKLPQRIDHDISWVILALISLIIFFAWLVFILFVCRRRFTSITEYVVLAISTPAATLTFLRPLLQGHL